MGYRTLTIKRRVEEIPPEQLVKFLEVQQKFQEWATEWYKSGFKTPMSEQNPFKRFAKELKHAMKLVPVNGLRNGVWRVPLPFDAELRLGEGERDNSCGVLVDLPEREVRIRKWSGERNNTIVIKLEKSEVKWIEERVKEGAELKLAYAWVGEAKGSALVTFNIALVFHKETQLYRPKRLLVVDVNALHNGVAYAVVEEDRILQKSALRPDLARIGRVGREASRMDELCADRGEPYCLKANYLHGKVWRLWREFVEKAAKRIVDLAVQYKAGIVIDEPLAESMQKLKEGGQVRRGAKKYLDVGRLVRRITERGEWHGVPIRVLRLYSTVCPKCGAKMEELPDRRVRCQCGFEAQRDEVPIIWAQKRYREILPLFSQHDFQPSHLHST
jgi:putative transposase